MWNVCIHVVRCSIYSCAPGFSFIRVWALFRIGGWPQTLVSPVASIQAHIGSGRIRRWSLLLSAYEYSITFQKTQDHGNADALSRLPLQDTKATSPPEQVLLLHHLSKSPVTARHISVWTRWDPILSKVKNHVEQGWPRETSKDLSAFSQP